MSIKTQEDRGKFSRKRKRLVDFINELKSVSGVFMSDTPVIKGYVYELKTKCGKKTCACARGEVHCRWVVSEIKEVGKQLKVIPKGEVVKMKIMAERYRKIRKGRARVVVVSREMLKLIDEMEAMRRKELE
jgi:hypothetical protein